MAYTLENILHVCLHSHAVWALTLFSIMMIQSLIVEEIILTMKAEGFKLGWFFSFLNALATFFISCLKSDRKFMQGLRENMTAEHIIAGSAYSLAQGMAGVSTIFLRFNTVTVFKSSKVVFVMLMSHLILGEPITRTAISHSFLMSVGLFALSNSDLKTSKHADEKQDSIFGIILIVAGLATSAIGNVIQQAVLQETPIQWLDRSLNFVKLKLGFHKLYSKTKTGDIEAPENTPELSRRQVKDDLLLYSSFTTTLVLFCVCFLTGELLQGYYFFWNQSLLLSFKQLVALFLTAMSQRLVLSLNQVYGATSISVLLTVRKVSSFVMSVLVFPKPFNFGHAFGVVDVAFFALLLQTHIMRVKKSKAKWKADSTNYLRNFNIV